LANFSGISRDTFIGKILRAPLCLIPPCAVVPILQGPLRGKRWTVGSGTHGCWLGSYEYEKQKAIQRELKAGDVMYDVGSNVGFYSLLASVLVGEAGHVYAFEPAPDNLIVLKKHLEINRVRNCTVVEAAVTAFDGNAAFDPSDDRFTGHLAATGNVRVRTLTLDRLLQDGGLRPPNLIKIDVEGAELDCLRGASSIVQNFRPVIFLATHGQEVHASCCRLLTHWNYRLESLDSRPVHATAELLAFPSTKE
jgi:FkbM family methyltransferase